MASNSSTQVEPAMSRKRLTLLVAGDAVTFLIFALVGRRSHSEAVGLEAFGQVVLTALPFALAWFIVAPFLHAYRARTTSRPGVMAKQTALAWLVAWPLSMVGRVIITQHVPEWTFFLISFLSNLILLQVWRQIFVWSGRITSRS